MEAVVLVMEAFQGHEGRIQYDVVGHSGESHDITFIDHKNPPTDNKQRLAIIKVSQLNCTVVSTHCSCSAVSSQAPTGAVWLPEYTLECQLHGAIFFFFFFFLKADSC